MDQTRMSETSDRRLHFPHVARNREPILEVLRRVLPRQGLVLEIASGGGQHAAYFASNLPGVRWQPTDANAEMFESIAAHRAAAGVANLLAPLHLDVTSQQSPGERSRLAVSFISMVRIRSTAVTPRRATRISTPDCARKTRSGACAISPTYRIWRNAKALRSKKL